MTYTYDKVGNYVVWRMRLLINDSNMNRINNADRWANSALFMDEELEGFHDIAAEHGLAGKEQYYFGAALALRALLNNKAAMMTALRNGTYGENYQVAIEALAAKYENLAGTDGPAEDIIEFATTPGAVAEYLTRDQELFDD